MLGTVGGKQRVDHLEVGGRKKRVRYILSSTYGRLVNSYEVLLATGGDEGQTNIRRADEHSFSRSYSSRGLFVMVLSRVRELGAGAHGNPDPDRSQGCSVKTGTGTDG